MECNGVPPDLLVAPGTTLTDTLRFAGPAVVDVATNRYFGVLEGTFRIDYGTQESNDFSIALPPEGIVPRVTRDTSAAIQTDSLLVHLTATGEFYSSPAIRVSIHNPMSDTSFIVNCGGATLFTLEKEIGDQWVPVWGDVIPGCVSPAIAIPPGSRYMTSIDVSGAPLGSNAAPGYSVRDIPGVYRLVWADIVDSSGKPIPIQYRRSNAFAIVTAS
jgi:hypothetical protein